MLELRVRELQQLFDSLDPTPFLNKDLDGACEAFIENWALALPHASHLQLNIHVEQFPVPEGAAELVATNNGSDRDQLSGMAKKARAPIGTATLTAIADRSYFKGEEILACHEAGICTLVPPTKTSRAKADGQFDKADFIYDPQKNEYRCLAGESLIWRFCSVEKRMTNHRYWSSNCKDCSLKTSVRRVRSSGDSLGASRPA